MDHERKRRSMRVMTAHAITADSLMYPIELVQLDWFNAKFLACNWIL